MMEKQKVSIQRGKGSLKKLPVPKQPQNTPNKNIQKSHTDKYILEPITTVSGQKKYKKYEKLKKIGKGTYSQCFLVKTVGSQSQYALKIIPKNKLQVLIRQKLIYQIKIQQSLSHPHVVYLDHWFQDDEFQYIFMQYCQNGNLESKLQQMSQFPQDLIRYYAKQIVESLMYIHSKNVLHRDLKMCNFYLDENDHIKLGDFGFACQLNHSTELKRETCGTPNYIAPQAISGFGYSFSADVWAIGVILYRMKFAYCPFQGPSVKQTLENVKTCKYGFPKGEKISAQLKDLIMKIFNLNYDERLTLQQIYCHAFFENKQLNPFSQKKQLKKEKRGFSLTRLFSSSKQKPKQKSPKSSKNIPIRSNSCETFKKIKETFKQKNLNTLITVNTMPTQQNSFINSKTQTLTTIYQSTTSRENGKNVRDIIELYNTTSNSLFGEMSKKADRNSRLAEFLAKQDGSNRKTQLIVKEKPKAQIILSKGSNLEKERSGGFDQMLKNFQKMYFFPISYTYYKDIIVVSFPQNTKLLICSKSYPATQQKPASQTFISKQPPLQCQVYVIARTKFDIYNLSGQRVQTQELSKVVKYVIEKKISFDEVIQSEEFFNAQLPIATMIEKLPNQVLKRKEGIMMIYGTRIKGYLVAKSQSQQLQYLASLVQKRLNTLFKYNPKSKSFLVEDGPVIARIYSGWTQQLLSSYFG